METGISNWHIGKIEPTKWGFCLYFRSLHD